MVIKKQNFLSISCVKCILKEEAELRSDGTRSMIKPSQMSLARVTCVRSAGPLSGEPFIDDYISTQEQVNILKFPELLKTNFIFRRFTRDINKIHFSALYFNLSGC